MEANLMNARRPSQRGMSLVEVLVSLTVLMLVGLATVQMLIFSFRLNHLASQRSVATSLASERLQQLTAQRYQPAATFTNYKLLEETASAGPPPKFEADFGRINGFPDYKRIVTLKYDTPVAGMLRAECRVLWRSVWQNQKEHQMVVYLHPQLQR